MSDNTLKRKIDEQEEEEPPVKRAALDDTSLKLPELEGPPSPVLGADSTEDETNKPSLNKPEPLNPSESDDDYQVEPPKEDSSKLTDKLTDVSPSVSVPSHSAPPSTISYPQPSPPPASPPRQSPYSRSLALGQLGSLINAYGTSTPAINPITNSGVSQAIGTTTSYGTSQAYDPVPFANHLDYTSRPMANHQAERELDPTYVSFRMYCPVKEASFVIGKRGDMINHLREKANARIQVSENIKDVQERIILVKGPAENVAKAFGLITRAILEEPEDEPASIMSRQYNLKVLIPHPMVGYIIGKGGSKFREIEENSAAKLKAAEQPLPNSTDRVLSVLGVGDAIHIAIYYISQVIIEHKDILKKHKIVYYTPGNNQLMNNTMGLIPNNTYGNTGIIGNDPIQGGAPFQHNYQRQFQPSAPSHNQITTPVPTQLYTDEHGNTMIGDVITSVPVPAGTGTDKFSEDVFVANTNIGSVIGKGGNNIKQIRESSGCSYVKIEPDQHQTIMLGRGRGLTSIRKLTLTGSINLIQTAIYLINQRIVADKERNM